MIKWQRINELVDEVGSENFDEVIDLFIEEVEGALNDLNSTDVELLRRQMHFLKGSALNLGFQAMANLCQLTESDVGLEAIAADRISEVRDLFERSKNHFLFKKKENINL